VYKSLEVNAIDLTGDGTTDFINALPISITDQCEPKYRPLALDGLQENTTPTPPVQPPVPPPVPALLTLPAEGGTAEQPGRAALAPLSAAEAQQQLGGAGRSPAQTAAERRQVPYAEKGEALRSLGERIAAAQPAAQEVQPEAEGEAPLPPWAGAEGAPQVRSPAGFEKLPTKRKAAAPRAAAKPAAKPAAKRAKVVAKPAPARKAGKRPMEQPAEQPAAKSAKAAEQPVEQPTVQVAPSHPAPHHTPSLPHTPHAPLLFAEVWLDQARERRCHAAQAADRQCRATCFCSRWRLRQRHVRQVARGGDLAQRHGVLEGAARAHRRLRQKGIHHQQERGGHGLRRGQC
jgi:hypothetical protein